MPKAPRKPTLSVVQAAPIGRRDRIKLDDITLSPEAQIRANTDPNLIAEYAEAMLRGDNFPPIVLYENQEEGHLYLADGFHRHSAAVLARHKNPNRSDAIDVIVFEGSFLDAVRHAAKNNSQHGSRMNEADYRHAYRLINDRGGFEATSGKALIDEVVATLGCSQRLAYDLTGDAREAMLVRRDRAIVAMHREGKTQTDIAKAVKVSQMTVSNVLNAFNKNRTAQNLLESDDDSEQPPHAPALDLKALEAPVVAAVPEPEKPAAAPRSKTYSYDLSGYLPALNKRLIDATTIKAMEDQTAPIELFSSETDEDETPVDDEQAIATLDLATETSKAFLESLSTDHIDHLAKRFSSWRAANSVAALRAVADFATALADFIEERGA